MKGPRMLNLGKMMPFETLQEMGARKLKWQKTHHAARSSEIEEHAYRKSEDFTFEAVGRVDRRIQFDLHHPMWLPSGFGQVLNTFWEPVSNCRSKR